MLTRTFIVALLTSVTQSYFFVQQLADWQDAQDYCLTHYSSPLATITTEAEYQQALRDIDGSRLDTWIGFNDLQREGVWQWIDGTSCSYTSTGLCTDDVHWNPNEPNDSGTEDCGVINPFGFGHKYNDLNCERSAYFLCNPPNIKCADTLLTDLTILSSTSGWSQSPYINTWLGMNSIPMGDGNMYDNFLVIHPPDQGAQSVEYELNRQYEKFTAVIGAENSGADGCGENGWAFSYNFYVDNVLAYRSPTFNHWDEFVKIEIDVLNVNVLRITINSEGSHYCDHATLGNPLLICPSSCNGSQYNCQCESDKSVCIDGDVLNNNAVIHQKRNNNDGYVPSDYEQDQNTKIKIQYWVVAVLFLWTVISVVIIIMQQCKINKLRNLGYEITSQHDETENIRDIETCKDSEHL